MDHREASELLAAYLDNEVTDEQRKEIKEHLATCRRCRRDLGGLKSAQDALRQALRSKAAEAVPSSEAWTRLQLWLDVQRPSFLFLFRRRRWRIVGTIIALAIVVALAILWGVGVFPGVR